MTISESAGGFVLGVSGSAIPNSNTDRAVQAALEATGCETEFVKLSEYTVAPCTACLGCVETNVCVIDDAGILLAEKAKAAAGLVIGCYTPYSSIDARTKTFLERLYPLRHRYGFMNGKPGGAIVTSAIREDAEGLPPAAEMGLSAIEFYMMEEGMQFMGAAKVVGNVPCIRCGQEDECEVSGLKMLFGPEATVDSVGVHAFCDQSAAMETAREVGAKIGAAVKAGRG